VTTEEEWAVQQRRTERTKKETLQKERSEKRTGPSCRKKKLARYDLYLSKRGDSFTE
jgi:hypothetical protein